MPRTITRLYLLPFAFFLLTSLSLAQSSTATLSGTVQDEHGAVIPDAAVLIQNRATSLKRTATTNESGSFTVPLLPPGEYTVLVEREGFTRVQLTNIVLNVGDQKAVSVRLKVGDIKSEVQVTADAELVRTDAAVSTTIDRRFADNLPLNGRSFQSLILLTPGVVVAPSGGNNLGQFSVNGQRTNANYFTVDGVSANAGAVTTTSPSGLSQTLAGAVPGLTAFGGTNALVSVDALEEFKIQTSTYSAEYGRQPGGQISLVTRSGNNQFHGSLFEYVRNEKFDANDWFANAAGRGRSPLRQNQFGGTFGGPVFLPVFGDDGRHWYTGRNKTFFFVSYEGLRLVLPQARTIIVPSARLRNQATPAVRTVLNAFPVSTSPETLTTTACTITNPACDPITLRLFSGSSPFTAVYSDPSTFNAVGIRIDHRINDHASLFGRFNNAPSSGETRAAVPSIISENKVGSRSLTLGVTLVTKSGLSNELKFIVSRDTSTSVNNSDNFGGAVPINLSTTVPDPGSKGPKVRSTVLFTTPALGSVAVGSAQGTKQRGMNLVDNITWISGRHQLKFGVDYRRLSPVYSPSDYNQNIFFTSEAQLRSGTAQQVSIFAQHAAEPVFINVSVYGQDSWKISRRLTVDFGLRWEINPPPGGDGKNLISITGLNNLPTATLAPVGTPIYSTDYRALAPRIGVAYQLSEKQGRERVIRGGFGVYYDIGSGQVAAGFTSFPFAPSTLTQNVAFPLLPTVAVPPPDPVLRLPITSLLIVQDPDLRLPYTLQWNVSLEQALGAHQAISASYVASAGRRLLRTQQLNQVTASGQRPNPNFGTIQFTSNGPTSDYHSLQLQYKRRFLQTSVNYTWSHAIDEASDETTLGVLDRGDAAFDVRHNLSSAITYDLPGRKADDFVGKLLRHWSVDGIVHLQSATPINLTAGTFIRSDGTFFTARPDLVPGQTLYVTDAAFPGGRRINPAAFTVPPRAPNNGPLLRQGTLGRNVLRALPLYQIDLGVRRRFNLTERLYLQLKAEAFNIFNHPNFGGIGVNITTASTFGLPTQMLGRSLAGLSPLYQIGGPRSLQFSFRLGF